MNGRRTAVGLGLLCALILSAMAAQAASAAGTTAYTCVASLGSGDFGDAHCKESKANGGFKHVAVPKDTTTEGSGTGEIMRMKATIGGLATELVATSVSGSGWMENKEAGGEMYVQGEATTTFSGVTVASPAGKGCKVYTDNGGVQGEEGVVHTNKLKGTSQGQGHFGKLEPAEGEVYATFIIAGCKGSAALEALNKTYSVTGSVKCPGEGSTVKCTHAEVTAQNTLKLNGSIKLGIEGQGTATGRANSGEAFTALSVTT